MEGGPLHVTFNIACCARPDTFGFSSTPLGMVRYGTVCYDGTRLYKVLVVMVAAGTSCQVGTNERFWYAL